MRALASAVLYFGLTFAIGAVIGTGRELYLAPIITSDLAVVIETPLMMWVSWHVARLVVRLCRLNPGAGLAAGAAAVVLLLLAEDGLTRWLRGRSYFDVWYWEGWLAQGATVIGLIWFLAAPWWAARAAAKAPVAPIQGVQVSA